MMEEVVGMGLGSSIRSLREEIGLSQAQLAGQAELSQGYLSQIENNEVQNPSASVLFRLAQALHVDPRCLLEAAGYRDILGSSEDADFETPVDPDLLRFLARRLSLEQQRYLLCFLQGMQPKTSVGVG
jgi:transcriptional regulator with XRE-family HTH domain